MRNCRPIYDWSDGDVWKAIKDNGWDYNAAYNTLYSLGIRAKDLRVAPPTMNAGGIGTLARAAAAWPRWFDKVCKRCPGVRTAAQYGKRSVQPTRRLGETWEQCFTRECITDAPEWIGRRAAVVRDKLLSAHTRHSTGAFPDVEACHTCHGNVGSWRALAHAMYCGDPFSTKTSSMLPFVELEEFRKGAGYWKGKPDW